MKSTVRALKIGLCAAGLTTSSAWALPEIDICNCLDDAVSFGDFRASDEATYAAVGASYSSTTATVTIPIPPNGRLVFDSFVVDQRPNSSGSVTVQFQGNEANDPVRLLVRSDVMIASGSTLAANGYNASGTRGGLGGPGGFRGGDGSFEQESLSRAGGPGLGPGGGLPGGVDGATLSERSGQNGRFVGSPTLNPLVGGSGGGGGSASGSSPCTSGAGGGGGGAILIAANGNISIDGSITTYGGGYSSYSGSCGTGGYGSAGPIHLVASAIEGRGYLYANSYAPAIVRMQAFTFDFPVNNSSPNAIRSFDPGPVDALLTPSLAITSINGESVSLANGEPIADLPQGNEGGIDVLVGSIDPVTIEVASENVPGGTSVQVSAKPRVGGDPLVTSAQLGSCDGQGRCVASTLLDLEPGTYFVEARALFR